MGLWPLWGQSSVDTLKIQKAKKNGPRFKTNVLKKKNSLDEKKVSSSKIVRALIGILKKIIKGRGVIIYR